MINVYDSEDVGHFLTWIYSLFRLVKEEGVVLLGSPLGSAEFEAKHIRLKVDKIKDTTALLPLLEDPHTEFVFLRSCLALPKISFLLRAVRAAAAVDEHGGGGGGEGEGKTTVANLEPCWRLAQHPPNQGAGAAPQASRVHHRPQVSARVASV